MHRIRNFSELARSEDHVVVLEALEESLLAADPKEAVKRLLVTEGRSCFYVSGIERKICPKEGVYILGFGKAAKGMVEGALEALGETIRGGVVINPYYEGRIGPVEALRGDHPIPSHNTLRSSQKLLDFASSIPRDAAVLVLISGGGSALFEVPRDGVSLRDVAEVTEKLMKRGADIYELNAVRKHLSKVKGGQLLKYVKARPVISLVISDVVGDRLDTIASGPTVPDETTFRDAFEVLNRYGVWEELPESVRRVISSGLRGSGETPKSGDPVFSDTFVKIVASNVVALRAASRKLQEHGYRPLIIGDRLRGEAREVGRALAGVLESIDAGTFQQPGGEMPTALIAGGETTVTVRGRGVGGRNQELCLSLALELARYRLLKRGYVAACMGTDGVDGNSPAAGALVDDDILVEARKAGLNPIEYLNANNTYEFFKSLGRAIDTGGYTGTNVNDVFLAVLRKA
ncbi:MAG: glycerate kinase [Thermoproteota archaeon]